MFGKLMSVPDAAMGTYYELLLGEEPDPGLTAGGAEARPRHGARGALPRRRTRPRPPSSTSTACTRTTGRPRRSRRSTVSRGEPARTASCTCRRCWPTTSALRAARPGGCWARAGSASTASRWVADDLDVDAAAGSTAAVLQVGRRKFRRIRRRRPEPPAARGSVRIVAYTAVVRPLRSGAGNPARRPLSESPDSLLNSPVASGRGGWEQISSTQTDRRLGRTTAIAGRLWGLSVGEAFFAPEPARRQRSRGAPVFEN